MTELIFEVREDPEGGYVAKALSAAIFTEEETLETLPDAIRDVVRCHFDPGQEPKAIRSMIIREEVLAA